MNTQSNSKLNDVIKLITSYLGAEKESDPKIDPVGYSRHKKLEKMNLFLEEKGFPQTDEDKCALSLVPYIFQEANYDTIEWTDKNANLDHLKELFDFDFYVQSGGKMREEVTDEEFHKYVLDSLACIDFVKKKLPQKN